MTFHSCCEVDCYTFGGSRLFVFCPLSKLSKQHFQSFSGLLEYHLHKNWMVLYALHASWMCKVTIFKRRLKRLGCYTFKPSVHFHFRKSYMNELPRKVLLNSPAVHKHSLSIHGSWHHFPCERNIGIFWNNAWTPLNQKNRRSNAARLQ